MKKDDAVSAYGILFFSCGLMFNFVITLYQLVNEKEKKLKVNRVTYDLMMSSLTMRNIDGYENDGHEVEYVLGFVVCDNHLDHSWSYLVIDRRWLLVQIHFLPEDGLHRSLLDFLFVCVRADDVGLLCEVSAFIYDGMHSEKLS